MEKSSEGFRNIINGLPLPEVSLTTGSPSYSTEFRQVRVL